MKTVLIVVSKDIIRRNILETDFWPTYLECSKQTRTVLIVEPHKGAEYRRRFAGENVVVEECSQPDHRPFARFLFFLVRNGIRTKSIVAHRRRLFARGQVQLPETLGKGFLNLLLGKSVWLRSALRALLLRAGQPRPVQRLFDEYKPDIVFTPSLLDFALNDVVALESKQRNIRLIGMVRSWDNLNHHGLLPVVPDRFIFQNHWLKEAAGRFQSVNVHEVGGDVIGVPHYDGYIRREGLIRTRSDFFRDMGWDEGKKIVFVGGAEYYYSEDALPACLDEIVRMGRISQPVQIVFRPHPRSMFSIAEYRLEGLSNVVLDRSSREGTARAFEDAETFINTLHYADVTVNVASTLSIDAAVFGKPAIAIDFDDPTRRVSYWESVRRFNDYFDHQESLLRTGGVRVASSPADLAGHIESYLQDPSLDSEGRERLLQEFAAPLDGEAGKRLGLILAEEVARV